MCRLPEKGRKEKEEIVEEMKERYRKERGTGMKVMKQKETITFPCTLTRHKDSKPCPINCKPISVGRLGDIRYTTPSQHPIIPANSEDPDLNAASD